MGIHPKQLEFAGRKFTRWLWTPGSPVMKCEDGLCGIDTETELIQNSYDIPHGVVAGFCSGSQCELVHWRDWKAYLPEFLSVNADTKLVFFNLPFDVDVLGSGYFLTELDRDGRMMELGANYRIHAVASEGWFPGKITLYDIALKTLAVTLNKEDGTRTSFTRDMELTDRHLDYLFEDCAATYLCGLAYNNEKTESEQARASYVLSQITRNGQLIDVDYVNQKRAEYTKKLLELGEELRAFGFRPKQDIDKKSAVECIKGVAARLGVCADELDRLSKVPSGHLWFLAALLYTTISTKVTLPSELGDLVRTTITSILNDSVNWQNKEGKQLLSNSREYLAEQLDAFDSSTCIRGVGGKQGKSFKPALYIIDLLVKHFMDGSISVGNMEAFHKEFYEEHEYFLGWLNTDQKPLSPDKFVQQHLRKLKAYNKKLDFPLTKGSKKNVDRYKSLCSRRHVTPDPDELDKLYKYAFSKSDMWLLEDAGVTDPFLEKYAEYKHCQKMLSTYFTLKYLEGDGRNHSKFSYFLVTGRTGSTRPNVQNYPKEKGLREQVIPARGNVLISCDYGQEEIVTLAATLKRRCKKSRMADLVNLGVDLHSFFSLYREHKIDDLDLKNIDAEVAKVLAERSKPYKEDPILKKSRALSKVFNFG